MRTIRDVNDPALDKALGRQAEELRDDLALLGCGESLRAGALPRANQTPVFFGSAVNNFGVRELLDAFVEIAPAPRAREAVSRTVAPEESLFGVRLQDPGRTWTRPTGTGLPFCGSVRGSSSGG